MIKWVFVRNAIVTFFIQGGAIMAGKEKFSLKGYLGGLKTVFTRNGILIILINMINNYGNNMKNAFRSLIANQSLGYGQIRCLSLRALRQEIH